MSCDSLPHLVGPRDCLDWSASGGRDQRAAGGRSGRRRRRSARRNQGCWAAQGALRGGLALALLRRDLRRALPGATPAHGTRHAGHGADRALAARGDGVESHRRDRCRHAPGAARRGSVRAARSCRRPLSSGTNPGRSDARHPERRRRAALRVRGRGHGARARHGEGLAPAADDRPRAARLAAPRRLRRRARRGRGQPGHAAARLGPLPVVPAGRGAVALAQREPREPEDRLARPAQGHRRGAGARARLLLPLGPRLDPRVGRRAGAGLGQPRSGSRVGAGPGRRSASTR